MKLVLKKQVGGVMEQQQQLPPELMQLLMSLPKDIQQYVLSLPIEQQVQELTILMQNQLKALQRWNMVLLASLFILILGIVGAGIYGALYYGWMTPFK